LECNPLPESGGHFFHFFTWLTKYGISENPHHIPTLPNLVNQLRL
jgi:hypothetical protein